MQALMKAGIKQFAFETIPSKKEAEAVVELLKEYPDVKAWISFSCKVSIAYILLYLNILILNHIHIIYN